jgi:hypothetical protein
VTDSVFSGIVALTRKNAMLAYTVPEESQALSQKIPVPTQPNKPPALRRSDGPADTHTTLP